MEQISVQHFQHQFNRVLIKRMPREEKKNPFKFRMECHFSKSHGRRG